MNQIYTERMLNVKGFMINVPLVNEFERCKHRDGTSIVDGDQEGVRC